MVDWIWGRYAALTYALLGAVGLALGALLEGSGVLACGYCSPCFSWG